MERLTEKGVGCFECVLKNHKAVPGEFGTYEAFFDYSMAVKRLGHYEDTGLEPEEIWRLRAERDAAIKALDEALIMDNRECFDGENFPCGYRQWCDLCDENEERGCAKAYLEWLSSQKEA